MSSRLKDELYGKTARTAALQWEFGFAHFSIKFREERKKYLDYMYFYDFKLWWWNCQPSSRQVKSRIQKSTELFRVEILIQYFLCELDMKLKVHKIYLQVFSIPNKWYVYSIFFIPELLRYSQEQKHVSVSDTPCY